MARWEYHVKGECYRPADDQSLALPILSRLRVGGTVEAPDVNAARVAARWHCERNLGMFNCVVRSCWLETRKAD